MPAAGVTSSVRHLVQDDFEAYLGGRLAAAKLELCRTHLDSCDACRAELEDLRTFRTNAAGLPRSDSLGRELIRRRRQRLIKSALIGAAATVIVAGVASAVWWKYEKPRVVSAATGASTATPRSTGTRLVASRLPVAAAAARAQSGPPTAPTRVAPPSVPPAAVKATTPSVPHSGSATPAATPANTRFALLGPFGDEITDTRPEFSWQPLAGATHYSVVIVDEGLRPINRSPALKTTVWRPRHSLRRGHTYLWQVTATLRNGTKVVASEPAPSEARLRIAPRALQSRTPTSG